MNISCLKFLGVRRPLLGTFGRGGADSWHQHCQVRSTFPQAQNCLPSSVSTGTKSHDLTMPWCEHSRFFILSYKHYQGSMCFPFPEFPFEFSGHYLFICVSFPVYSLVPQPPGSNCDQQGTECITCLKHKIIMNLGGLDVEDSIRHPEAQLCPYSSPHQWNICSCCLAITGLTSLPLEHLAHSNPCTRNNFPLVSVPLSFPFLILGAPVTCISKYLRKLCSRI